MVKHTVELEDIRVCHEFPNNHLPVKTLFVVKSARVHMFCSPSTIRAHRPECHGFLLVQRPQHLHSHIFTLVCPPVDLSACSRCIRLIGECYHVRINPIRERELLNVAGTPVAGSEAVHLFLRFCDFCGMVDDIAGSAARDKARVARGRHGGPSRWPLTYGLHVTGPVGKVTCS